MSFTAQEFFATITAYNLAVWPAQPILLALALTAVFLASRRPPGNGEGVYLVLSALWLWSGVVYHIGFYRTINPAAWAFGALFVLQGTGFAWMALWRSGSFRARQDLGGFVGGALIVYALIVYPIVGSLVGHTYPGGPSFGAPCPTTIFTFGLLIWSEERLPHPLLFVPAGWALVGTAAAVRFGVVEDLGLPLAALLALWLLVRPRPRASGPDRAPPPSHARPLPAAAARTSPR